MKRETRIEKVTDFEAKYLRRQVCRKPAWVIVAWRCIVGVPGKWHRVDWSSSRRRFRLMPAVILDDGGQW